MILTETSPHWVDVGDDFKPLKDGTFLWSSERSGYLHLYLYAADGKLIRQVTRGDWPVEKIEGVDETAKTVVFAAHKDRRGNAGSTRSPMPGRASPGP